MRTTLFVALLLLGLVGACAGSAGDSQTDKVKVIATTSVLGDVVGRIGGAAIDLDVMIPPGLDPHDFAPSAQQVAAISSADLIVANGLGLEEGLEDVLAQARSEGIPVIEVGEEVDPLPSGDSGDESGAFDPHFWQDPLRMRSAADVIAAELETAGVAEAAGNASEYRAEIDATHAEIEALVEAIPRQDRMLVTNHDAFAYFADRYGFEIIGTIIPGGSTLAEPSSAEMAQLVDTIRSRNVTAIFVENTDTGGLADILAEEIGTDIEIVSLVSDALSEPGTETGTYLGMMLHNATAIANALGR